MSFRLKVKIKVTQFFIIFIFAKKKKKKKKLFRFCCQVLWDSKASLTNKTSSLDAALGVTKFKTIASVNLVTLCCVGLDTQQIVH